MAKAFSIAGCLLILSGFYSSAYSQVDGYPSKLSVSQGENIQFFVSTPENHFDLSIYRLSGNREKMSVYKNLNGGIQPVGDNAFILGCKWNSNLTVQVPNSWLPGVYSAEIPSGDSLKSIIFVVRAKIPGVHSKMLVCLTANTWQAYNNYGGRSLYNYNSFSQTASVKVSFQRPLSNDASSYYFRWTEKLISWLDDHHYEAEYCVNTDLDEIPSLLSHYKVYVTVGHDEYWSRPERNAVKKFVDFGGRLICLSGNTCWWQVRFEDSGATMVCYRDSSLDPKYPKEDSIVTTNWGRSPAYDYINPLFGVSFEAGGFINDDGIFPKYQGYGGFTVLNSYHWIYKNTGVHDGDVFGANSAVAGYESDGTPFYWDRGFPIPSTEFRTPSDFQILGISPAASAGNLPIGHATMGYFSNAFTGAVFNGSSTDWVVGLSDEDSIQSRILQNVIARFLIPGEMPPPVQTFSPVRVTSDSINHERLSINHLSMKYELHKIDTFCLKTVETRNKYVKYTWVVNGKVVGDDSTFLFKPSLKQYIKPPVIVSGVVADGYESTVITWVLLDTVLKFISLPPIANLLPGKKLSYQAIAVSLQDEHPKYEIVFAPTWITMNEAGLLTGEAPKHKVDATVILRAIDSKHASEFQSFSIHVADTTNARLITEPSDEIILCYPNPSADYFHFRSASVGQEIQDIRIFALNGAEIKRIISEGLLNANPDGIVWNRTNSDGKALPEGVYYCKITSTGVLHDSVITLIKLIAVGR